ATKARAELNGLARRLLFQDARTVHHFAGEPVQLDLRLIAEVVSRSKLPRLAIKLPQNPELSHLEEGAVAVVVNQDVLEHLVLIEALTRNELVVPDDFAGVEIEGQDSVRVQGISVQPSRHPSPRLPPASPRSMFATPPGPFRRRAPR